MLLKQTIHKSKSLVRKTVRNLKSFFFGRYQIQKHPKSLSFKSCKADQISADLYEPPAANERRENDSDKGDVKSKEKKKKKCGDEGSARALARRMKELGAIGSGDMEQALDVEEAIHYYSRLKSPVYLDIVDKFFVDMYAELSAPHPSAKINNSKQRRGSFRL